MLRLIALFFIAFHASPLALFANRLSDSQSPYLLQHADNPVDWYPWGEEAFSKAQAENKLVFVSIGYSTCHWCHVMNRESFSDTEIAAYLNENYVCIKVDREERPDIDSVYMNFVQSLTGHGGWPLNVWLTPDKKPFFGGTYFPPRDDPRRGRGFLPIVTEINGFWQEDPDGLLARSQSILETLNKNDRGPEASDSDSALSLDRVTEAVSSYLFAYDEEHKGFGTGEKFPSANSLSLLLRAAATPNLHQEDRATAQRLALETLEAMITGGIHDQVGGGFHRYTVDAGWKLPHFEKMLYDQALIANALIDAWQLTGETRYRSAAMDTLDYVKTDLRDKRGGFYSAEDAESPDPDKPDAKREGAYYLWTTSDFETLFEDPDQRNFLIEYFGIKAAGNAPYGNFPRDIFDGYNTLRVTSKPTSAEEKGWLQSGLETLRSARERRERPHLDDKIITSWNGLAISSFARAGLVFDRPDYTQQAIAAAEFIFEELYDEKSNVLSRLYREEASSVAGFAEDYAFLIEGLLELYEATADYRWIQKARTLQTAFDNKFLDTTDGGYFLFEATEDIVFNRSKRPSDSALPSPNAVSAKNLARLSQFFDDSGLQTQAENAISSFAAELQQNGTTYPTLREAILYVARKPLQIVIAGDPKSDSVQMMLSEVNSRLLPARVLLYADQAEGQAYLGKHLGFIQTARSYDNSATVFVCENFVCQMPTEDRAVLARQLDAKGDTNH
ncbi:thioredoxin domain-containing protein [Pelagicoccus sp. SDUM812002]|uniref:thioredoxin domain-containing protein n=1 Tax=Pelagicoccus sp. SDUM812002 TaxID=3041266 RepID=UPI00280DDFCC|nr:thioredoxin domain-containing protein [Pelagicoccus sp. SDUM812002]MDQ8187825.1 thioredoxin domain-containing protein [Pelagicoccus sp. SDUM812002]